MTDFRVVPLPAEMADVVRTAGISPQYGHPAHREISPGTGPCRLCLSTFEVGRDERLLFTYDPFAGLDRYPLPGPIVIHARACARFEEEGFPRDLLALPLVLEAYGSEREPLGRIRGAERNIDGAIEALLKEPGVEYLHVRHGEAGCYIARVERAGADPIGPSGNGSESRTSWWGTSGLAEWSSESCARQSPYSATR